MSENEVAVPDSLSKIAVQSLFDELALYYGKLSESELTHVIKNEFVKVCKQYISLGNKEFELLEKEGGETTETSYLLHYRMPNFIKDVMLIHRDVLLQLQIGKHKKFEGIVSEVAFQNHEVSSRKVLLEAVDFIIKKFKEEEILADRLSQRKDGIDSKIKHHQNPWEIYEQQFETILAHLVAIKNNDPFIENAITVFKKLSLHTEQLIFQTVKESERVVYELQDSIFKIEKLESNDEIAQIIKSLEKTEHSLNMQQNLQEDFAQSIADITSSLSKNNIPTATQDGMLLEKSVDFGKFVKKWMDFNVLPLAIDIWDHYADLISFAKHSILNLNGSLVVSKNLETFSSSSIQRQSLETIKQTCDTNLLTQKTLSNTISKKLKSELLATTIYSEQEFLEISLQTSLTQYSSETNDRFTNWMGRIKNFFGNVNTAYDKALSVKQNNLLETATECIAQRMLKEENAQYDMLFLNKNFLGDHFLASRDNEETIFEKCLSNWNQGFHRAILVVGDGLSGKTTFINKAVKNISSKAVITIEPNSPVSFQGRKFNTTKNLKEALQEIKKSSYNSKPIVVIDNLREWYDNNTGFLDNVRAMLKFIESESDDILLIVSVSKLMHKHLDNRLSFSNSFTTHVDLNYSSNTEIFNAVSLRHGASHRKLVDEKEEVLTLRQFERLVHRLCKKFDNNMGEVLQAWTYGTSLTTDNKVVYSENVLYFPDFFTKEEVILLKYVLLFERLDERTLKTFLGKRYASGYESGLKRLANTKVLVRDANGFLSANVVIIHEIKNILIYRGILR